MQSPLEELTDRIDAAPGRLNKYRKAWDGDAPAAFLSKDSRDALDGKVTRLGVNYPRLTVQSVVERMRLRGFRRRGATELDAKLLAAARTMNLDAVADRLHTVRALYGAGYLTVWTSERTGLPVALADSPLNAAVIRDPATGEVIAALRTWTLGDDGSRGGAYMTASSITRYRAQSESGQWQQDGATWDNPLGMVPMVPFIRQQHTADADGTSLVADVLDLSDALAKVLADGMVNSEYYAKPRRWATGLEIVEDEDGNAVDPFGRSRFLQSEAPETKFGQLQATAPDGQTELVATLTQQIGALTGLPPHYLGLHGDQPANADGVRAAETQLTARVAAEQRATDGPWSTVAALMAGTLDGTVDPWAADYVSVWESAESWTPAQAADAAAKLATIGVPLRSLLSQPLGYDPAEVDAIMKTALPADRPAA